MVPFYYETICSLKEKQKYFYVPKWKNSQEIMLTKQTKYKTIYIIYVSKTKLPIYTYVLYS